MTESLTIMTRLLRALARFTTALYPRRAAIDRDEARAFLEDAIDDAWRDRGWCGLAVIAAALTVDLGRAWAGRSALPLTARTARHRMAHGRTLMDRWLTDLRYSWRALAHARGFAAVAVLTLALGIGATTAVGQGLTVAVIGLALGLVGAGLAARAIASVLISRRSGAIDMLHG